MLKRYARRLLNVMRGAVTNDTVTGRPSSPSSVNCSREITEHLGAIRHDQWLVKEAQGFLTEEALIFLDPRSRDVRFLGRTAAKMFSQNYEDAVIAEIFARIGEGDRRFIEIGSGDGSENTTRFLSMLGWSGVWLEGDPANIRTAREGMASVIAEGRLHIIEAMVDTMNVNDLVGQAALGSEIDFISIDIDQNTSHIWRALSAVARVVCVEYNAALPPSVAYEVPYDAKQVWDQTNHYGASLKALERIGAEKGMSLVGCDLHGVNAFFVRNDLVGDKFLAPFTAEQHFQPARFSLSRPRGHARPGWPLPEAKDLLKATRQARLKIDGVPEQPFRVHGPQDLYISECLLSTGQMEPLETAIFVKLSKLSAGFLDIGANIGYYCVIAARICPPNMPIIAIEPNPDNAALIRANARLADAVHRIVTLEAAVSDHIGRTDLYLSSTNFGDHRVFADPQEKRNTTSVETTTLARLLERYSSVDFIKIDTQGAEPIVLLPARDALRARRERIIVILEFWPHVLEAQQAIDLVDLLADLGLTLFDIDEDQSKVTRKSPEAFKAYYRACKDGSEARPFTNILATSRIDAIELMASAFGA